MMTFQDTVWRNYIRRDAEVPRKIQTAALRTEVESQVDEFLKAGGRIRQIPSGVSGQDFMQTTTQAQMRKKVAKEGFHRMQMRLPGSKE